MSGETERELANLQPNEELRLWASHGYLRLSLTRRFARDSVYVNASMANDVGNVSTMLAVTLQTMREELDAEEAKSKGGQP